MFFAASSQMGSFGSDRGFEIISTLNVPAASVWGHLHRQPYTAERGHHWTPRQEALGLAARQAASELMKEESWLWGWNPSKCKCRSSPYGGIILHNGPCCGADDTIQKLKFFLHLIACRSINLTSMLAKEAGPADCRGPQVVPARNKTKTYHVKTYYCMIHFFTVKQVEIIYASSPHCRIDTLQSASHTYLTLSPPKN